MARAADPFGSVTGTVTAAERPRPVKAAAEMAMAMPTPVESTVMVSMTTVAAMTAASRCLRHGSQSDRCNSSNRKHYFSEHEFPLRFVKRCRPH